MTAVTWGEAGHLWFQPSLTVDLSARFGHVTRLICLNRASLDVSAGRRRHSSSASLAAPFAAAGKPETFKLDGQAGCVRNSYRRSCHLVQVVNGAILKQRHSELTFWIPLKMDKNANVQGIDFNQRRFALTIV